jgi:hypothetical protein
MRGAQRPASAKIRRSSPTSNGQSIVVGRVKEEGVELPDHGPIGGRGNVRSAGRSRKQQDESACCWPNCTILFISRAPAWLVRPRSS